VQLRQFDDAGNFNPPPSKNASTGLLYNGERLNEIAGVSDIQRIPTIDRLPLPGVLPHPKALASHKENETTYHPDLWEPEYAMLRYLSRMDDDALRRRYDSIVRNMRAIVSESRHMIPIRSFLSSWYGYR
jgi:hypothetical protein